MFALRQQTALLAGASVTGPRGSTAARARSTARRPVRVSGVARPLLGTIGSSHSHPGTAVDARRFMRKGRVRGGAVCDLEFEKKYFADLRRAPICPFSSRLAQTSLGTHDAVVMAPKQRPKPAPVMAGRPVFDEPERIPGIPMKAPVPKFPKKATANQSTLEIDCPITHRPGMH